MVIPKKVQVMDKEALLEVSLERIVENVKESIRNAPKAVVDLIFSNLAYAAGFLTVTGLQNGKEEIKVKPVDLVAAGLRQCGYRVDYEWGSHLNNEYIVRLKISRV